jgi:mannose-6-phosphate isomerase-like protein (cupin superfamily)
LTNVSTPDWTDHATGKWLILLRGSAAIDFDGDIGLRQMHTGDYVFVPPLQKHRITATSKMPTVWLVVSVKEKKVATKCRVKKKRIVKKKHPTEKPVVRQRKFNFGG